MKMNFFMRQTARNIVRHRKRLGWNPCAAVFGDHVHGWRREAPSLELQVAMSREGQHHLHTSRAMSTESFLQEGPLSS